MSQCRVNISLREETVRPGGPLVGTVHVHAEKECQCESLDLQPVLEVSGVEGTSTHRDEMLKTSLFSGKWYPGDHTYDFEVTAPKHPMEFFGKYVNFTWRLEARARLRAAIDPTATAPLKLVAPPDLGIHAALLNPGDPNKATPDPEDLKQKSNLQAWGVAALLLLGCAGAIVYGTYEGVSDAFWGGIATSGLILVYMLARISWRKDDLKAIERQKILGRPQLTVEQKERPEAPEGKASRDLECSVWLPKEGPEVKVKLSLLVNETSKVPQGEHSTLDHLDVIHAESIQLRRVEPGCFRGWLSIPDAQSVPTSCGNSYNSIGWEIHVYIEALDSDLTHTIIRRVLTKLDL
jgi:hypothetical protein